MKSKILVVENEEVMLHGIREVLERENYEVMTALNGNEGLELLKDSGVQPDLILSDIMMPGMDGYEFIEAVREELNWVDIPFIFLTAKTERKDQNKARVLGADDYLHKPFQIDELIIAVSSKIKLQQTRMGNSEKQILSLKNNIMTIIHHELRTPLTYVIGYSDLLKSNPDPDSVDANQLRYLMGKIDKGAQRLRNLIENFIMLVELQTHNAAENFKLNFKVSNYEKLFHTLIRDYQEITESEDLKLVVEIDPNTPPILSNGDYLTKVMDCLLDNAVKFSDAGQTIVFKTQRMVHLNGDVFASFKVIDEGMGVDPNMLSQIFEPFFQAVRHKNEHPGTGSGLAIAKGLVDLHEGVIEVKSKLNEGSTFMVLIPAYDGHQLDV